MYKRQTSSRPPLLEPPNKLSRYEEKSLGVVSVKGFSLQRRQKDKDPFFSLTWVCPEVMSGASAAILGL